MNEDVDGLIKHFMENWGLKPNQRFFAYDLPNYVWYIDQFNCLFVSKPEWDGYKIVDDAVWMKLIACSMIRKMPAKESEE